MKNLLLLPLMLFTVSAQANTFNEGSIFTHDVITYIICLIVTIALTLVIFPINSK